MKVKATDKIKGYRGLALGVDSPTFRKLRGGFEVDIKEEVYKKNPAVFEIVKESKKGANNGN